jgi:hypothetical protein
LFFDFGFDVRVEDGVAFEEFLGSIAALGELGAVVGERLSCADRRGGGERRDGMAG